MRTTSALFVVLFSVLLFSCTKKFESEPVPDLPPPADYGHLIYFKDTLTVIDANTGKVLVASGPYGTLLGASKRNTTIDDSLAYQPTLTRLLAINIKTGKRHFIRVFAPYAIGEVGVSPAYPIIEGNRMYLAINDTRAKFRLHCIDKISGELIWQGSEQISADIQKHLPSITHTDKAILVNLVDGPAAFDKQDGKLLWQNKSSSGYNRLEQHPLVYNNELLISKNISRRMVYAFDVNDGHLVWQATLSQDKTVSTDPAHISGNMYCVRSNGSAGPVVTCLNAATGAVVKETVVPKARGYIEFYDKYFYTFEKVESMQYEIPQRLNKYELSSGSLIWSMDMAGRVGYGFVATPAHVYLLETPLARGEYWQKMHILSQADGKELKSFDIHSSTMFEAAVKDQQNRVYYPSRIGWNLP